MDHDSIHHPDHEVLVEYLRELRVVGRHTQAAVAAELDRPQTYISEIENRRRGLDLLQVRRMLEIYGVSFPKFAVEFEKRAAIAARNRKRKPKA